MPKWFSFLDVVIPPTCLACGAGFDAVASRSLCQSCALHLPSEVCRIPHPRVLQHCWSLGAYDGLLGQLVRRAKYQRSLAAADFLGQLLGKQMVGLVKVDAVVPVPTTWVRRVWRGFDQSEQIARGVAARIGVKSTRLLVREGRERQVGKSAKQRQQLSHAAFVFRGVVPPKRVLLVDDVVTTGATIRAAAQSLRRSGVEVVWGASIAHQQL